MPYNCMRYQLRIYLLIGLLWSTCAKSTAQVISPQQSPELALEWFRLQLHLIRSSEGFAPPVAARALGYTSLALYESLVPGMPQNRSLVGILNDFKSLPPINLNYHYQWLLAANATQATLLKSLYPHTSTKNLQKIDSLYLLLEKKYADKTDQASIERSVQWGERLAKNIFEYSKTDGGHEAYLKNFPADYQKIKGACLWTPSKGQDIPLLPYWGHNRTFLKGNADFELPEPPRCEAGKGSLLYAQALEVYSVGKNLSEEQKQIAYFWADEAGKSFTPPGHALSIACQIIQKERTPLTKTAEILCKLGIGMADAFISCWKCKFMHNLLRPSSYIRSTIDPTWEPLLPNPPFPEYTSGHASVSGAAAQILSDYFGFNYAFTDFTHVGQKPRSFDSFFEFANEAANSRLFGGIHYRNSNEQGLKNGKRIGKNVCNLNLIK